MPEPALPTARARPNSDPRCNADAEPDSNAIIPMIGKILKSALN